jgi:hypothetical protein
LHLRILTGVLEPFHNNRTETKQTKTPQKLNQNQLQIFPNITTMANLYADLLALSPDVARAGVMTVAAFDAGVTRVITHFALQAENRNLIIESMLMDAILNGGSPRNFDDTRLRMIVRLPTGYTSDTVQVRGTGVNTCTSIQRNEFYGVFYGGDVNLMDIGILRPIYRVATFKTQFMLNGTRIANQLFPGKEGAIKFAQRTSEFYDDTPSPLITNARLKRRIALGDELSVDEAISVDAAMSV